MKPTLSKKAIQFKRNISPVRQIMSFADKNYIKKLGLNPKNLISFAGGWVNHDSPKELIKAYSDIVNDEKLFHESGGYPPTLGESEFKKSVIEFEKHLYGMNNLKEENIGVGLGSTQLTTDLLDAILDPNDKILLLDPSYCNYPTQIITRLKDIEIINFNVLDKVSWEYNADTKLNEFHDFILEHKPKAIMLVSPDNPTSKIPSDAFFETALNAATKIGSFLIVDFAYKELVFNQDYPKYFSKSPNDNFIALRSNSKWCRGLGRRLGWIEASEQVIESLESLQNSSILCPDMMHQMAFTNYVKDALKNNTLKDYIIDTNNKYSKAAQKTTSSISKYLDFNYLAPKGGLYTCINVKEDGGKFVEKILKETGVLFVPGWGFGRSLKEAVRVSFGPLVNNLNLIDKGFNKVANYIKK